MQRRAFVLVVAAALAGCSKPEPPKVTPISARVAAIDAKGIGLSLELDVQNPNSFPLVTQSVQGTLEIGSGVEVGKAVAEPKTSIPAKGSSRVTSRLYVGFENVAAFAPFALSPKPVPYSFRGVARMGGEKLNVDVPFTVKGELSREQVVQIGLRGLKVPQGLSLPAH